MQVWTVAKGLGIGSEFSQTCCAANNFRDHDLTSPLNSLPSSDPTHAVGIGPDILLIYLGFGADHFADFAFQEITGFPWQPASAEE